MKYKLFLLAVVACAAFVFAAGQWEPVSVTPATFLKDVPDLLSNNFQAIDKVIDSTDPANVMLKGSEIKSGTVAASALASDSVDSSKIVDNSIVADDIGMYGVGTGELAYNAVTGSKIADDAVDSRHIVDGSVDAAHLAADVIDGTKVADDAVDSEHIAADSLDAEHYAAGSVDTTALGADAVDATILADDSVDSEHLVDGSIDTAHLADGCITPNEIATATWEAIHDMSADGVYDFYLDPILMAVSEQPFSVTIQTKQDGAAVSGKHLYRVWFSDNGTDAPTTDMFDSCNVTTGTEISSVGTAELYEVLTDSTGKAILTVTETVPSGVRGVTVHAVLIGPASQDRTFNVVIL